MAQGQLAAALAEVTHLKAEKVGPVSWLRCGTINGDLNGEISYKWL